MLRLRILFIASLVVLIVLLVFTVFGPMVQGEKYSEVVRESIIEQEDEWIIQFGIFNREGADTSYVINWSTGGEIYNNKTVSVADGRIFTNIHHVYPHTVKEGKVRLEIYREGETTPFERSTYYVSFDGE